MMVPLSSDIAKSINMPLTESGLLVSIYPMAAAISAFFLAPFSDRFGRKRMLLFLGLGFALSCLGCAMAATLEQMYLFRILSGVFGGLVLPNALAYAGDEFEENQKVRAISTLTLSFPIASVMGVPIGAWLGDLYSWRLPFYALAVLSLLCTLGLIQLRDSAGTKAHSIARQYLQLIALWKTANDSNSLCNAVFYVDRTVWLCASSQCVSGFQFRYEYNSDRVVLHARRRRCHSR